jgi:hypothetical protein
VISKRSRFQFGEAGKEKDEDVSEKGIGSRDREESVLDWNHRKTDSWMSEMAMIAQSRNIMTECAGRDRGLIHMPPPFPAQSGRFSCPNTDYASSF